MSRGLMLCLICQILLPGVDSQCAGSCGSCTRRYGCLTPAWGKCCTHFFMQNGKRSVAKNPVQKLVEYIKMKREIYPGAPRMSQEDILGPRILIENLFPGEQP